MSSCQVGNAFDSYRARQELDKIASSPAKDYVFKVSNFGALSKILSTLEENIIAIEGITWLHSIHGRVRPITRCEESPWREDVSLGILPLTDV